MNLIVIVLSFVLGGYVAKSMETMTPEKVELIEREKNEKSK